MGVHTRTRKTKMRLLLTCLCLVGAARSTPVGEQRAFDALVQRTREEAKKLDSDSKPKSIAFSVIERNEENDYKVVLVPASTWACTVETVAKDYDPYANWRSEHGTAVAALGAAQDTNTSKMFKRLFQYIVGVNSRSASIDMTVPVTNKIVTQDDETHTTEMCFYLGDKYADKEAPAPIDDKVFIQNRDPTIYFVREFGGWALSNNDWRSQLAKMLVSVKDRDEVDTSGTFFTVSFDSPFDNGAERRNQIWIPKKEGVSLKKNEIQSEKLEHLSYVVKDKTAEYELREYGEEKWICSEIEDVNPELDPMNGWQDRFDSPLQAFQERRYKSKERPSNKMFMRMFRYIAGVNMDFKKIEMTIPVPTYHIPTGTDQMEDQMMCFWLGTEYRDQMPPQPAPDMADKLKIVTKPKFTVYVREFGGYAMSDEDYRTQYELLKAHLVEVEESFVPDVWSHVSYDAPFQLEDRR